jgi:hypothetical protein
MFLADPTCRLRRKHSRQIGRKHPRDVGRDQDRDRMVFRRTTRRRANVASLSDAIPEPSGSRKEIQHSTGGSDFEVDFYFGLTRK